MNGPSQARALPYVALAGCLIVAGTALTLTFTGRNVAPEDQSSPYWLVCAAVVYLGLGTLLVLRRPHLVLPWLLIAFGLCLTLSAALAAHELQTAGRRERLDAVLYMAFAILIALIVQLFPTGAPLPGRWRWVTTALLLGGGLVILGQVVGLDIDHDPPPVLRAAGLAVVLVYAAGMIGSLPMLVVRFRQARGAERAQLKWFLFSIAFLVVGWFAPDDALGTPYRMITNLASLMPAVAIALALLRYRLYDIDRIVSRTVAYTVVTGLLLGTYAVVTTVALRLLPNSSSLAVAAATLAAAAVARPAVRRVQAVVDRRFDRTRYDQLAIVDDFGERMRDAVDPDDVAQQLVTTVQAALQPSSSALIKGVR